MLNHSSKCMCALGLNIPCIISVCACGGGGGMKTLTVVYRFTCIYLAPFGEGEGGGLGEGGGMVKVYVTSLPDRVWIVHHGLVGSLTVAQLKLILKQIRPQHSLCNRRRERYVAGDYTVKPHHLQ